VVDTYYTANAIKNAFSGTASFTSIQDISCTGLFAFVPKNGIEQNVISVDDTNYTAVQVQNAFGADFEHLKYKGVLTIDPSGGETSDVLYVVDTSYTAVQVKEALDNVLVTQFTDLSYTGVLSILPASDASDAIFVVDTSYTAAQVKAAFERGPDITIAGDLACRDISYNGTLRMNGSNTVLDISGTTYTAVELNELLSDNSIPVQSFDQGLYVKPGGTVGIGTDGMPTNPLEVVGNIKATSFSSSSDYRLKTEIVTISGSTYSLDNLRPVEYKLKSDQQLHYGFLAHELQQMYPSMVNGVKDGEEMQSIQYQELIPLLVKEIQELKAEVKLLKKEI
jgi:nitrogen fixation protein